MGTAAAQSALNFTPRGPAWIAVTNPAATAADVVFTLYKADGSLGGDRVSQRIPPNGQLALSSSDIFRLNAGLPADSWIQATSPVTGLQGFYFAGDKQNSFDGAEASVPLQAQTVPLIESGGANTLLVTNPSAQSAQVTVSFFSRNGLPASEEPFMRRLAPHEQVSLPAIGGMVRVETDLSSGVLATAVEESARAVFLIPGQATDNPILRWVVPYFKNQDGVSSSLVLANPSSEATDARISFFEGGEARFAPIFTIPANGSLNLDWKIIANSPIPSSAEGWLSVESERPLAGVAFIDAGESKTAIPLQASGSTRILFSRAVSQGLPTRLTLVGDLQREATVRVTLSRPDGSTAAQGDTLILPRASRIEGPLGDFVSTAAFDHGFLTIQSSVPIFSLELMELGDGNSQTVLTPQRVPASFVPGPAVVIPKITVTVVGGRLVPGARLKIEQENLRPDAILWVGSSPVLMTPSPTPFGIEYEATLPGNLEPGLVTVKARSGGVDSNSENLGVYSLDSSLTPDSPVISGYAFFQKIEVTDTGLDPAQTIVVPIRRARVEVVDPLTQFIFSISETDEAGRFEIRAPNRPNLEVRVVSRLRGQDLRVLNNSAGNVPYFISSPLNFDQAMRLADTTRVSGAFNILDALQRGNTLVVNAVPGLIPPALTVYWSEKNDAAALAKLTNGAIRTTFFNPATNSAYILGDRNTDSDEFDDSVLLHEYAHLLAVKFSRDDSNGGPHLLGDLLDPRIAWSEGWANFFSSAARGSSIYRDSKAQGSVLRFDLEDNVPSGDQPGYTSEASVGGLLWDLIDENADKDDTAQFPFATVWAAFSELTRDRNVYLPLFLERFLQRAPAFSDGLRTMVIARSIDFQPDVRPSVTNPFPRLISIGQTLSGQLDSFTTQRTNLKNSAAFFSLSTASGGQLSIRLFIDNPGPANKPDANDLDLFLYDSTGKQIIGQSDDPINGGNEIIPVTLAPGTYYIEVRSFYIRQETKSTVFNSGGYRLAVERRGF